MKRTAPLQFRLLDEKEIGAPSVLALQADDPGVLSRFIKNIPDLKGEKGEKGDSIKGDTGRRGRRGERGLPPDHTINKVPKGYELRFCHPEGDFGDAILLEHGARGPQGLPPEHRTEKTPKGYKFAFRKPNGDWGEWVEFRQVPGPKGDKGDKGDVGPMPRHEFAGTRIRFEQPGGGFGEFVDIQGPPGQGGGGGIRGKAAFQGYADIVLNGTNLEFTRPNAGPLGSKKIVDLSSLGGGGGQVDSVLGGTNISVDATDPINPVVNLDAIIAGVSVNGVVLTDLGVGANYLDDTGAYSVPPLDTAAADANYLRLDTTNDPLTGTLNTQNIEPDIGVRDVGLQTNRFRRMFGKLGVFVNSSSTPGLTLPSNANHGGLIAGSQNGPGTNTHVLNNASFPAVACIGNAATTAAGGTATMQASRGGATVIGSAYAYTNGVASVRSTGYASTAIGYAYGSGTSTLEATNSGSTAIGYARGRQAGQTALFRSSGSGSVCFGFANAFNQPGNATMQSSGSGAFVAGNAEGRNTDATIRATGAGSFAQGRAISSAASGAALIEATGLGSFAQGLANAGQTISASATNAVQFGVGTNALADSLQVGAAGLRLKGTVGAPSVPQNGDFWVNAGYVYVRSNGTNIKVAGPGPLTN